MIVIFGALEMLLMLPLAPEPLQIETAASCSPSESWGGADEVGDDVSATPLRSASLSAGVGHCTDAVILHQADRRPLGEERQGGE